MNQRLGVGERSAHGNQSMEEDVEGRPHVVVEGAEVGLDAVAGQGLLELVMGRTQLHRGPETTAGSLCYCHAEGQ